MGRGRVGVGGWEVKKCTVYSVDRSGQARARVRELRQGGDALLSLVFSLANGESKTGEKARAGGGGRGMARAVVGVGCGALPFAFSMGTVGRGARNL